MAVETLSRAEARSLMLNAQGLAQPLRRPARKRDVLVAIRRMGVLQIDTISVIARSPYLVLWSRLGDYNPAWLEELLAEGELFEYWAHAACFLPREAYPLFRHYMLDGLPAGGWKTVPAWVREHRPLVDGIMDRIRRDGAVRSADFENPEPRAGSWWNWKDEKTALECLWILGELMVARRHNFQRVYDLRERVRPDWQDGPAGANVPSREAVLRALTLQSVQALGVARAAWVPDYFRLPKTGNLQRLEALADEGLLTRVEIEELPGPAYRDPAAKPAQTPTLTTVLSPFDPLIWHRDRLRELFDINYVLEIYIPAARRKFGYFTLPILHRGAVVGRLDPKAHRALGQFEVKSLALEPGVEATDELVAEVAALLRRLAAWHGTPDLVIGRTKPASLAKRLRAAVAAD